MSISTLISLSTSTISNTNRPTNISSETNNEEDQLNRINLQALQNRDPYIAKIIDQAQRVCVYKFIGEKREWERKDLEGTLFVYERTCEPYHGFVILSTVSRETFVQIIKPSMEFKHSPNYEAFLQYKVDVGDIYGIWFISKNDCPGVTECLKRLTIQAKEIEQSKQNASTINFNNQKLFATLNQAGSDIFSLLVNAQEKFQETKRKQEVNNTDAIASMPAALLRLFSTQDASSAAVANNDEREQELKKTLGILGKPALSVTELEKKLLQPPSLEITKPMVVSKNNNNYNTIESLSKHVSIENKNSIQTAHHSISSCVGTTSTNDRTTSSDQNLFSGFDTFSNNNNGRLMTPAEFQTLQIPQTPVFIPQIQTDPVASCLHCQNSSMNRFSKDTLRQLLIDMLKNDEEFLTGLHNAYTEKQNDLHRIY
ncbi:unnamed protein product [Rotaria magnacalcarata]|uniref:Uncharacterized protein n=1 Tax=Rotaria magnacalcarata TaxID=392030 RepID=A0A819E667_9BILA|nr:unnamed protein product [Rotaria magnacalcarata]CAF3845358.1 unnamed protein product [Rotaria magnacalcarata]